MDSLIYKSVFVSKDSPRYTCAKCSTDNYQWLFYHNIIFILYLQEIKKDNEIKGTTACKIVLYRTFLKCGTRTWERVIKALQNSDHDEIADHVKLQLLINYSKVINVIGYLGCRSQH